MKYFRNEIDVKDSYHEIQKMDAIEWNTEVKKLNSMYLFMKENEAGGVVERFNNLICIQLEHMKMVKPSWITSKTR
jgi:hypothetical protein